MNRANQLQLVHQVNQQLLDIRHSEINYYVNLYQTFGVIAALIGGI